jgi:hypothetical protein
MLQFISGKQILKREVVGTCSESNPIASFVIGGVNSSGFTVRELVCVHACKYADESENIVLLKFCNMRPFSSKLP